MRTVRSEEVLATIVEAYAAFLTHAQVSSFVNDRHDEYISVAELKTIYNQLSEKVEKKRRENATKIQILSPLVRVSWLEHIASEAMQANRFGEAISAIKAVNDMMPNKGKVLTEEEAQEIKSVFEKTVQRMVEETGVTRAEAIQLISEYNPEVVEFIN